MTTFPRLHRRPESGVYYCRVAVPKELVSILNKREIHVSLKTTDSVLARHRLVLESLKIDQQFAALRGVPIPEFVLSEENGTRNGLIMRSSKGSIALSVLIDRYFAASEQSHLSVKTKLEYGIRFKVVKELLGEHTPIAAITREDCRQFQQTVMVLPPNVNKRFPNMKLIEVAEHAKRERLPLMAPKTINQHISCLNLLLDWACRERLIDANPARGLYVRETVQRKDKRDPFSIDQLNTILGSGLMYSYRDGDSAKYWIPRLALWTGARLNELCQLRTVDVVERDGIHVLLVHEGDGNKLKTVNANRIIPIHPALADDGFMDYVATMQQCGDERLFPEIRDSVRGYPSEVFSKWFTRYLKSVKAKTERTCFHSFRHNFRDAMREAGVERELVQAIGGWSIKGSGTEEIYGKGFGMQRLYDAICKVEYKGLNVS